MDTTGSVVFLHIPKTAGQAVHLFLQMMFGPDAVSPARANHQLQLMSVPEIRRYRVVSGHLDWSALDCVGAPKFVFTILREPVERLLSFYFFVRRQADLLSDAELDDPARQGMKAARRLSCNEYFLTGESDIRAFLDQHYDNFYAYYFAARAFDGYPKLRARLQPGGTLTEQRLISMALDNLSTLDGVYRLDDLQRLDDDLRAFARQTGTPATHLRRVPPLTDLRINVGQPSSGAQRMEELRGLGASPATLARIGEMTLLDGTIWRSLA